MVEKVSLSAENSYIRQRFAQMPDLEKGEERVIKSGESLWKIAKSEVGKQAKKGEVNDYMLKLAKLNGFDTIEKMNNIKANSKIYLVGSEKKQAKPANQTPAATNPQRPAQQRPAAPKPAQPAQQKPAAKPAPKPTQPAQQKPAAKPAPKPTQPAQQKPVAKPTPKPAQQKPAAPKPAPKPLSDAEKSFSDRTQAVLNDKTISVEKSTLNLYSGDKMYHVMQVKPYRSGGVSGKHPVMSFLMSRSGQIKDISYEGYENVNPNGYDYQISNGKIIQRSYVSLDDKLIGTADKKELEQLEAKLKSLVGNEEK